MIDADGYRANVGIILANGEGKVLWCKRVGQQAWQFPQGGIQEDESPEQAMFRELYEELGLQPDAVKVIACTKGWLRYRLPKRMLRVGSKPLCIGQKQKWFLLHLKGSTDDIALDVDSKPEFDGWSWVSYWYPVEQVISFKRSVYRRALKELSKPHSLLVEQHDRSTE